MTGSGQGTRGRLPVIRKSAPSRLVTTVADTALACRKGRQYCSKRRLTQEEEVDEKARRRAPRHHACLVCNFLVLGLLGAQACPLDAGGRRTALQPGSLVLARCSAWPTCSLMSQRCRARTPCFIPGLNRLWSRPPSHSSITNSSGYEQIQAVHTRVGCSCLHHTSR